MPTNHSSFLKMIGIETEETAPDAAVDVEGDAGYSEVEVEIEQEAFEQEKSSTQSETEWDPDRLENLQGDSGDATDFEESEILAEDAEPVNEPAKEVLLEDQETNFSKVSVLSRLSRIMSRVSRIERPAIDYENARTNILANETTNFKENSLSTQALQDVDALEQDSELDELMQSEAEGSGFAQTKNTVPFNYEQTSDESADHSPQSLRESAVSVNRTAHFDYDEASGVARFVVLEGNVSSKAFYLGQLPLRMGRDPLNEIVIDDTNVSRYHAEIRERENEIIIVDVGSTNGVKLNGELVQEAVLKSNDIVQVGDALFEFLSPGVLSKGVIQAAAVQASTPIGSKRSKKNLWLLLFLVLGGATYLLTSNRQNLSNQVEQKSKEIMATKMYNEVTDLKAGIEKESGKSIADLQPEEVKKAFLSHVEQSMLVSLLPSEFRQRMTMVPAEILKIFLEDPKVLPAIVSNGATLDSIMLALRSKLADLIQAGRLAEALSIVNFLSTNNPKDEKLKKWKAQLEERLNKDSSEDVESKSKTEEILKSYEKNFDALIERGRIKEALDFANKVHTNAIESITKFPQFADRAKAEADAWAGRVTKAESLYEDYKKAAVVNTQNDKDGDDLFEEINSELDFANVVKARKLIEEFLRKHPTHPKLGEVVRLKKQLEDQMSGVFASTKSSIESLMKAESFENAWTEIYRFLDQMPDYSPGLELKLTLDRQTAPRATQYYNQARVFEFEADDLVAAEQYYKRAIDVADPRGELYKKAQRRYADVKRKSIR